MDELQEILQDFLVEAFEMIEQLDQDLVELEQRPEDLDLLNRIFRVAHTIKGSSSFLNFDATTMKFSNPLSVFYTDNPSPDLVNEIVKASSRLTPSQVQDFVGLAATILKTYKARQTNKDADAVNRTS